MYDIKFKPFPLKQMMSGFNSCIRSIITLDQSFISFLYIERYIAQFIYSIVRCGVPFTDAFLITAVGFDILTCSIHLHFVWCAGQC